METQKTQERTVEPFSPTFTPNPPQVMNPSLRPEKDLNVVVNMLNDNSKIEKFRPTKASEKNRS